METSDDHRSLADDVFETTYSNSQRVVVNYHQEPYALSTGQDVPARGFLLLGP